MQPSFARKNADSGVFLCRKLRHRLFRARFSTTRHKPQPFLGNLPDCYLTQNAIKVRFALQLYSISHAPANIPRSNLNNNR